jgi:PleD family two-component response regulator
MHLRILVVEPHPEDALFLREVLADIEAERHWGPWVPVQAVHAAGWEDALEALALEPVDLILLSLASGDAETFRRIQAAVPQVPVVLLLDPADPDFGLRLIREGAQDFLARQNADSRPLAHAIRNAVERHRVLSATRASATIDPLTGLANRAAFSTHAERDRKLAERLGRRWMLLLAEALGRPHRDLGLIETADHLRILIGSTDLLARIDDTRFAITVFDTDALSIEAAWARLHANASAHHISIGAAIFDPERPVSLDSLLERAALDLAPASLSSLVPSH